MGIYRRKKISRDDSLPILSKTNKNTKGMIEMCAEIEATNKILNMSEVMAKKMLFAIGEKDLVSWEQLDIMADVFGGKAGLK